MKSEPLVSARKMVSRNLHRRHRHIQILLLWLCRWLYRYKHWRIFALGEIQSGVSFCLLIGSSSHDRLWTTFQFVLAGCRVVFKKDLRAGFSKGSLEGYELGWSTRQPMHRKEKRCWTITSFAQEAAVALISVGLSSILNFLIIQGQYGSE